MTLASSPCSEQHAAAVIASGSCSQTNTRGAPGDDAPHPQQQSMHSDSGLPTELKPEQSTWLIDSAERHSMVSQLPFGLTAGIPGSKIESQRSPHVC